MGINASFVSALAEELNTELSGGRIDKVQQPSSEIILITVRCRGFNRRLLLSASSANARIHLTETEYENPAKPPMFCMLLRKHIIGAVIERIEQPTRDRILSLSLTRSDEFGRDAEAKLIVEMIPGKVNILLVGQDGLIIDCIHRRDYEQNLYRRCFPGMIYRLPLVPDNFTPSASGQFVSEGFQSISEFLDAYYSEKEKQDIYRRRTKEFRTSLVSARKRIERKLEAQRNELAATSEREKLKRSADLITANLYRIRKGDTILRCEDFYEDECPETEISLDPMKTPQANAAFLYKEYNRKKTAEEYLVSLISKGEEQLEYIASAIDELERAASDAEIDGIRDELMQSGIIRSRTGGPNTGKQKKTKKNLLPYLEAETKNGLSLLAGRNNLQNDELTFRVARKSDLWFHVKDYHGSHVIMKTLGTVPEPEDLREAALFAVKCSSVSSGTETDAGSGIMVDYTEVRFVKKISGALPGRVTYTAQKTIIV